MKTPMIAPSKRSRRAKKGGASAVDQPPGAHYREDGEQSRGEHQRRAQPIHSEEQVDAEVRCGHPLIALGQGAAYAPIAGMFAYTYQNTVDGETERDAAQRRGSPQSPLSVTPHEQVGKRRTRERYQDQQGENRVHSTVYNPVQEYEEEQHDEKAEYKHQRVVLDYPRLDSPRACERRPDRRPRCGSQAGQ